MFEIETEKLATLPVRLETSATAAVFQGAAVFQFAGGESLQAASISQSALALAIDL